MQLIAPFTAIHLELATAFLLGLANTLGEIGVVLDPPLLACVTIWIIVQGVLIIRGDVDTRNGVTRLVMVALVVGLVTSDTLYEQYVAEFFTDGLPAWLNFGDYGIAATYIPEQLDLVFQVGEKAFQLIAAKMAAGNTEDIIAFEGAQAVFYFSLWSIFSICDIVSVMTSVLVAIGPLILVGYLFEATRTIAVKWIGQLVTYALLLMLVRIVATIVVSYFVIDIAADYGVVALAGPEPAKIIGLCELDMFLMTGNAIVLGLPAVAAALGGGVAVGGTRSANSFLSRFMPPSGAKPDPYRVLQARITNSGNMQ